MSSMELNKILNSEQLLGVTTTEGPVLILAGAGSGKTRVLTHRVAYLMEQGVEPYHIMAITFTNKAAAEMRERVDNLVGHGAGQVWVATFHSTCVRMLRQFADRIGYDTNFSIYDADDSKTVMKEVCKHLNIDTKKFKEKNVPVIALTNGITARQAPDAYLPYPFTPEQLEDVIRGVTEKTGKG